MSSRGGDHTSHNWLAKSLGLEEEIKAQIAAEEAEKEGPLGSEEVAADAVTLISEAENNVNMLAALAIPEVFQYLLPKVLLAAWQLLVQYVRQVHAFHQVALGIPRGHGKTTLIKLFILFIILFTNRKFVLVISATQELAQNVIADVFDMLSEPNILKLFGDWRVAVDRDTLHLKKFAFRGRTIIIAAIGAHGSLRGLNIKNERPDIMIFEDVQTKECSESDVQSDALLRWMIGTAMKAKSPHGCLNVFCGNMYPGDNSILKKLKKNPTWIKFISGAILADGTALWPELRSLQSLIDELNNDIAMGHPEIFFSEVMNDTEVSINPNVDLSKIPAWPWGPDDIPQGKFIIIDPSSDKKKADLVALGYFEVYDGKVGLRKLVQGKFSPGNTIRQGILLGVENKCKFIAIESNAYQYSLLYWWHEVCKQLGIEGFEVADVYRTAVSKNSAISNAIKGVQVGEVYLHPDVRSTVIHQISNWNPLKRNNIDDALDLLTYAPKVLEEYGPMVSTEFGMIMLEGVASPGVPEDNHAF